MSTTPTRNSVSKIQLAALLLFCIAATGCAFHGGHKQHVKPPTLGDELTDLQTALDKGAIFEQEYLSLKSRLMNSREH